MDHKTQNDYWIQFVDRLSVEQSLDELIPEVLHNLCTTFEFGCGFFYRNDHNNVLHLQSSYEGYENPYLMPHIDLRQQLSPDLTQTLIQRTSVSFTDSTASTDALEQALSRIFGARSMIFIATLDKDQKIMAFAGLLDRRSKPQYDAHDTTFMCSLVRLLSNNIKTQLYRQQAQNAQSGLESALDNMGIDVYINDFKTHEILYVNRSMAQPYGGPEKMIGKICWQALYSDKTQECDFCPQKKLIDDSGNPTKVYSWDYQRPFDGAWFRVLSASFPWHDGRLAHIVSSVDISENKRNEEIIRQIAEYDYLTGLPNRYSLSRKIDALVLEPDAQCYLLFFDLDGFKLINDTLGHKAGDEVLRKVGEAIQENPLTKDRSYRYGGDEFVVILEDTSAQTLQKVLSFLHDLFHHDWKLEGETVTLGISVGISHCPTDDTQTGSLIRKADQAMYMAKRNGKGRVFLYHQGRPKEISFHETNILF